MAQGRRQITASARMAGKNDARRGFGEMITGARVSGALVLETDGTQNVSHSLKSSAAFEGRGS